MTGLRERFITSNLGLTTIVIASAVGGAFAYSEATTSPPKNPDVVIACTQSGRNFSCPEGEVIVYNKRFLVEPLIGHPETVRRNPHGATIKVFNNDIAIGVFVNGAHIRVDQIKLPPITGTLPKK